jgi:hypothetical protein
MRVVDFTPLPIYPQGNSSRYQCDRRMVGPNAGMNAAAGKTIFLAGNRNETVHL